MPGLSKRFSRMSRFLGEKGSRRSAEESPTEAGRQDGAGIDMNAAGRAETERTADGKLEEDAEPVTEHDGAAEPEDAAEPDPLSASVLRPLSDVGGDYRRGASSFEQFVDERILVSHDAFGRKEMKIKVLEVSDEPPPSRWKFGDRVKLTKILITIKHLESQNIEEGELDIEAVEKELIEKRHYTSTNRWVPVTDIKNGYVIGSRHTSLISDAVALDYITF